jgi:hypothetical protein
MLAVLIPEPDRRAYFQFQNSGRSTTANGRTMSTFSFVVQRLDPVRTVADKLGMALNAGPPGLMLIILTQTRQKNNDIFSRREFFESQKQFTLHKKPSMLLEWKIQEFNSMEVWRLFLFTLFISSPFSTLFCLVTS